LVLGYTDQVLYDDFYDGLKDEIKMAMVSQNFKPHEATRTFNQVRERALEIDSTMNAINAPKKLQSPQTSTSKQTTSKTATSTPNTSLGQRFNVNDRVFMSKPTGGVQYGKISSITRNAKGRPVPQISWDDGTKGNVPFGAIQKDTRTSTFNAPIIQTPKSSTPAKDPNAMDLDGKGKGPMICFTCGGKGHSARVCPSKNTASGFEAQIEEISSDTESGKDVTGAY
jgi:hypothetical protein